MALQLFSNNAETTLAIDVADIDTSLTVTSSTGSLFTSPTGGDYELLTLSNGIDIEIIKVTARSGDVFTIVRAQENTTALNWYIGDTVSGRITKGTLDNLAQVSELPTSTQIGDVLYSFRDIPTGYLLCNGSTKNVASYPALAEVIGVSIPTSWVVRTEAIARAWSSVCYSSDLDLFCAVSPGGSTSQVQTSPDGITWTSRTSSSFKAWESIVWANNIGLFVVVSNTNRDIMTSPDGITWTSRTSGSGLSDSYQFQDVCYENNLLVAVSHTGLNPSFATSTDGITWSGKNADGGGKELYGICYSPELSLYCAVGYDTVQTSPDGNTWTARTPSNAGMLWKSVAWSPTLSLFCAVSWWAGGSNNKIMTSPDGITWTQRTHPDGTANGSEIRWSNICKAFFIVNNSVTTNNFFTSTDGISWTIRATASDNYFYSMAESISDGKIVLVSNAFSVGTGKIQTADLSTTFTLPTLTGSGNAKYYIKAT